MISQRLESGIPLSAVINPSGGGIAKAALTFLLVFVAMTASASWYYNLQYDNATYGRTKKDVEYKSITNFNCPSGAPSYNGKSSDIVISFAGEFEDGHITYAKNTTIKITAPDGYRIETVVLDEPDRVSALSSKNYGNYSYSCTEGTGKNQKMTITSKDAGLKEISFTTNDNRRQFHSRCIKVWIVKEVESWLTIPDQLVNQGSSVGIPTLSDYASGGNGNSYTATTTNASVVTYDTGSNKLNGVGHGTANITVKYAGNDIYATGSKTFKTRVIHVKDGFTYLYNKDEWDWFTSTYNGSGNYALGADISGVTSMVGTASKPFTGIFDGQRHNLSYNYNVNEERVAPFRYVNGATFRNLYVTGNITVTDKKYAGGIAGEAVGNASSFDDCYSSTTISWTGLYTLDHTMGGFLGMASAPVNFNNCWFNGNIKGNERRDIEKAVGNVGGFVGWSGQQAVTVKNSLMTGQWLNYYYKDGQDHNNYIFVRGQSNATIENCYWAPNGVIATNYNYIAQGTSIDLNDSKMKDGYVASLLQGSQTETHWGQKVGTNDRPQLTNDASQMWVSATFVSHDKEVAHSCANRGGQFSIPSEVEGKYLYSFDNKTATGNVTINMLEKGSGDIYEIATNGDWETLAAVVGNGATGLNVRMTADITTPVTKMVGSSDKPFIGTFDGQGHTLTVNYTSGEQFVAPFRAISGSTITNLRTAGTISGSKSPGIVGGLAGDAVNDASTISNCESAVNLVFTGSGDATHAGFLGRAEAPVTFNSCAFTGSMTAANGNAVGGFVGWADKNVIINNSLVAADINVQDATSRGEQGNACFGRNWRQYTVNNSYVVKFDNINVNQGTYVTDSLVQIGEMAYVLQNSQDKQYWGQVLGTDGKPSLASDNSKRVYKASFTYNNEEVWRSYANPGKGFDNPSLRYVAATPADFNTKGASGDLTVSLQLFATGDNGISLIKNIDDWNYFTTYYNGVGDFRLDADLTGVTTMAGTDKVPFKGTFDGAGHTLNVNYTSNEAVVAPFRYVEGATIRDLNVTGTEHITGTDKNHCSGLLASANGATIERCTSSVALTFDNAGDAHSGGLVGHAQSSTITIRDCAFTGSFTQPEGDNQSVGGLIGWGEKVFKADIKNSYVDMTLTNITGQNNFVRAISGWNANDSKFDNCFYTLPDGVTNDWDPEPATKVTAEQMKGGYVANLLQKAHGDTLVWGQTITGSAADAQPLLTADNAKRVFKATFTINDNEVATSFANTGNAFAAPSIRYVSSDPASFNSASADITVTLNAFNTDADGYALINDLTDWNTFAAYGNIGNYRLGKDISDITTPAATKQKPFTGTFDGQGHTLTVNYSFADKADSEQEDAAPFRAINGATIKNVRTAGVITTKKSTSDAAGLVGESTGTVSIDNCESAVDITYNGTGDATNGGLIGRINDNSNVSVNNCAFTGSLKSAQGHSFGGLIGWAQDKGVAVAISNSLVAADIDVQNSGNTTGNAPFSRNAGKTTVTNSYYRDFNNIYDGYRRGTKVTDEQLQSGWTTYNLQGTQTGNVWGQTLSGDSADNKPLLSDVDTKHVFRALFKYNDQVVDSSFTNKGVAFPVPAMDGYLAVYSGDVASADLDIRLLAKQDGGDFLIASKADWDALAASYNGTGNYRLGANIEGITTMLGSKEKPFTGTFDGQGYTMTVNYDAGDQDDVAPFRFISGATFKNLRIAGTISGSKLTNDAAGFAGEAIGGDITFTNCESAVDITFTGNGDATNGGFLGRVNGAGNVTFDNCLFSGSFTATNGGNSFGGFVGWTDAGNTVAINNSLVAPKSISVNSGNGNYGNASFVRNNPNSARIANSYYVAFNNLQVGQGAAVTADQLKAGEVAHALQGSQTKQYWGQLIGTDNAPLLTADSAKHVFQATFGIDDKVLYTSYANRDQVFPLNDVMAGRFGSLTAERDSAYQIFKHDADGFNVINTEDDWNLIASFDNLYGNFRLGNDISVGTMVKSYTGTFDGADHTLTVSYDVDQEENAAPFRIVNGATIMNLRTAGKVTSNKSPGMASGLVGNATGDASVISNCESAVNLTFTGSGDATHGGFLGRAQAQVTISNSAFTGSITAKNGGNVGGFVGWAEQPVTIDSSLMAASMDISQGSGNNGNGTFARNSSKVTVNNSYYRDFANSYDGFRQGNKLDETQIASGEMTHLLQGTQDGQHWGQTLGTDSMPLFTTEAGKRVYMARYMNDSTVVFTAFANSGEVFPKPEVNHDATYLTVNALDDVVATQDQDIDYSHCLTLNLPKSDKYTVEAKCGDKELHDGDAIPATGDLIFYLTASAGSMPLDNLVQTMRADGSESYAAFKEPEAWLAAKDGYGLIGNKAEWDLFAQYATTGNFRLTADIDTVTTMAGTQDKPFTGTFDGEGHTLTVNYNVSEEAIAPFRYISGAVIRNLHTAGTIMSDKQNAGGIAGMAIDNASASAFYDCQSSVNMFWIGDWRDMTWGGILGSAKSDVIFERCVFDGGIIDNVHAQDTRGYNTGGFLGWSEKSATIRNGLVTANITSISRNEDNATFARGNNVTVENSYWVKDNVENYASYKALQGTAISHDDAHLSKGYLAYLLQDKRDSMYWGQTLGTDASPVLTPDASKRVYAADCQLNGVSLMAVYANNGQAFQAPSYIKVDELDNAVASGSDRVIALGEGLKFALPKSDNYKVTATLGGEALADNGWIANTDTLTFFLADGDKTKVMSDSSLVMRRGGDNIFNDFTSPVALQVEDGYALISNKAEWDAFAQYNEEGNYRLAADIDSITTMVGTEDKPFTGNFDGAGHTLTVDYTGPEMPMMKYKAAFKYAKDATFKNLRTAGAIINDMTHYAAGGIACEVSGTVTFDDCVSAVNFTGTGSSSTWDVPGVGGLVRGCNGNVTFNNCAFLGSINAPQGYQVSGFVANIVGESTAAFNNCLMAGEIVAYRPGNTVSYMNTVFGDYSANDASVTVSNSYYREFEGIKDGNLGSYDTKAKATDGQLKSGYVAHLLQGAQAGQHWGQTIGKDATPVLSADEAKRVYMADCRLDSVSLLATFANRGRQFETPSYLKVDELKNVVAKDKDVVVKLKKGLTFVQPEADSYSVAAKLGETAITDGSLIANTEQLTFAVAAKENAMLLADSVQTMRQAGSNIFAAFDEPATLKTENGYGLISSLEDWNNLAKNNTPGNYRLAADIEGVTTMVGTIDKPFTGAFDGAGHKLTVDLDHVQSGIRYVAPFRHTKDMAIKNLRVDGSIKISNKYAGGFVGYAEGKLNIDDCVSAVDLAYTGSLSYSQSSGFVGDDYGMGAAFNNCAFIGSIKAENTGDFSGFMGDGLSYTSKATFNNCLMAARVDIPAINSSDNLPFVNSSTPTFTNCYYREFANMTGNNNATEVTDGQLKSGEVAYLLQGAQDGQHWGQTIGKDDVPEATSDIAKRVLANVYDDDTTKVYDNYVVISEAKGNKANIRANANVKANVKLTRTFAEGWNTLVLPFSLSTEEVNTAFGDETKVAYFTNEKLNTIELNYDETGADKAIDANTPVLIKPSKAVSEIGAPTFTGKSIADAAEARTAGTNGITFVGSYDASYTIKDGEYFISGDKLWRSKGSSTIKATRGYFTVPETSAGAKIMLFINGEDVATGIGSIQNSEFRMQNSGTVYTLSGQKVADSLDEARKANLKAGVYIVNGKKIVVK